MSTAHDLPEAIQWSEGMLLRPHHFQQATLRQESLLYYHAALIAPFHWGVRHLKIDEVLLVDGGFRVLELEAVMPDGLVVSHPAAEGADLTDIDGVRVKTAEGWWLLRASNTQDVLVARCEAADQAGLDRLKATVSAQLAASGMSLPSD